MPKPNPLTEEEIQSLKEKVKVNLEMINNILPENHKFTMTDKDIDDFARDEKRREHHERAKEFEEKLGHQVETFKEKYKDIRFPESFNRCCAHYYSEDQLKDPVIDEQIRTIGRFDQEGVDACVEFSKNYLKEIASFNPEEYPMEFGDQLFDKYEEDLGKSYRMFESLNTMVNLKNDFEIDPELSKQLDERQKAMADVGGTYYAAIRGFANDHILNFPWEKLSKEQITDLSGKLPDPMQNIFLQTIGNASTGLSRKVTLENREVPTISDASIKPTSHILDRKTRLEEAQGSICHCEKTKEDPKLKNCSPKYQKLVDEALVFSKRFREGIEDPRHFDADKFQKEYDAFCQKKDKFCQEEKARRNSEGLSDNEKQQIANDLWLLDSRRISASSYDAENAKFLKQGINEQIQKNSGNFNKSNMLNDLEGMTAAFKSADSVFSRPGDKAYKNFAKSIAELPKKLKELDVSQCKNNQEKFTKSNVEIFDTLYKQGEDLLKSCNKKKTLTANEMKRLKAVNEIMDWIEYNQQAAVSGKGNWRKENDRRIKAQERIQNSVEKNFNPKKKTNPQTVNMMTSRNARNKEVDALAREKSSSELVNEFASATHVVEKQKKAEEEAYQKQKEKIQEKKEKGKESSSKTQQKEGKENKGKESKKKEGKEKKTQQKAPEEKLVNIGTETQRMVRAEEKRRKQNELKEVELGGGQHTTFGRLAASAEIATQEVRADLANEKKHLNAERKLKECKNKAEKKAVLKQYKNELKKVEPVAAKDDAIAKMIAMSLIKAEREQLNGPGYLSQSKIDIGPMEKCLNQYGLKAFVSGVEQSPMMKGIRTQNGEYPMNTLRELEDLGTRTLFAQSILDSQPIKDNLMAGVKTISENLNKEMLDKSFGSKTKGKGKQVNNNSSKNKSTEKKKVEKKEEKKKEQKSNNMAIQ